MAAGQGRARQHVRGLLQLHGAHVLRAHHAVAGHRLRLVPERRGGRSGPRLPPAEVAARSAGRRGEVARVQAEGRFELQPVTGAGQYCLSQHHHPKEHEVVFPEECKLTRMHDTTYWKTY